MQYQEKLAHQIRTIILLTDGRPGHMTQSEGVARLLKQNQRLEVQWLNIRHLGKWQKKLGRCLVNYFGLSAYLPKLIELPQQIDWHKVDYVVSAGADTLLANVVLTRVLRQKHIAVKNIALSSLHGIQPKNFDVVFTINAAKARLPHYLYYPISPNKMTACDLYADDLKKHWQLDQVIAVCIGADIDGIDIGSASLWREYIHALKSNFPQHQILITTSRRTPQDFEQQLQQQLQGILGPQDQLFLYSKQQINLAELFTMAQLVVLSQDSGSMISEAVMAAKKTLVIQPLQSNKHIVMQKFLQHLQQQKAIKFWQDPAQEIIPLLDSIRVEQHSTNLQQVLQQRLNIGNPIQQVAPKSLSA